MATALGDSPKMSGVRRRQRARRQTGALGDSMDAVAHARTTRQPIFDNETVFISFEAKLSIETRDRHHHGTTGASPKRRRGGVNGGQLFIITQLEKKKTKKKNNSHAISRDSNAFINYSFSARIELDGGARTIVELLRSAERMDGADGAAARRPSFKERLGLKALACCGATWAFGLGLGPTSVTGDVEEQETGGPLVEPIPSARDPADDGPAPPCGARPQAAPGMNLAAALAAERQLRAAEEPAVEPTDPNCRSGEAAERVSLMRLLEQSSEGRGEEEEEEEGFGWVCCVCMGRKKGAAFIPCGHAFCRVCSRELWLSRGACPLCNRPILDILDLY
ncbi:RING/U-box superfamily protein [Striga hermonthica]|uniref:RING/U-box superfamily protein n=1 Tax=Striga hermonthica TaxID=68872 RepID=A0A9N7R837_STRHE|nr:RING/U-box superfamily protein [Striga hermonthica]